MVTKTLEEVMPSYEGWYMLESLGLLSIWKTPTRFCVSFAYKNICEFFHTRESAKRRALQLLRDYEPEYFKARGFYKD